MMKEIEAMEQQFAQIMNSKLRGEFSENECCQILAIVYVFGGNTETFTHLSSLAGQDALRAQQQLDVTAFGEVPPSAARAIKKYVADLHSDDNDLTRDWVLKWYNRWQVKPPKRYQKLKK